MKREHWETHKTNPESKQARSLGRRRWIALLCVVIICLSPYGVFAAETGDLQGTYAADGTGSQTTADSALTDSDQESPKAGQAEEQMDGAESAEEVQEADIEPTADTAASAVNKKSAAKKQARDTGKLIRARNLDEYIDLTVPDLDNTTIDVSKKDGSISGAEDDITFKEAFGRDFRSVKGSSRKICRTIENTEGYQVTGESKNKIHATSDYALGRIIVSRELKQTYGAQTAVSYDGKTLLTYDSPEATRDSYEFLTQKFGTESVDLDTVITIEDTAGSADANGDTKSVITAQTAGTEPKGWGTKSMFLDKQIEKFEDNEDTVTIAVLDSGINEEHEIFSDTSISEDSMNLIDPDKSSDDIADDTGHGTMVGGIIAESTGSHAELLVLKALRNDGKGVAKTTPEVLKNALKYASEKNVDIINMSLGGWFNPQLCLELDETLAEVVSNDILVVAASGNENADMDRGSGTRFYPADSAYTVAVGAIKPTGERFGKSNYGDNLDFVAPGADLELPDYKNTSAYQKNCDGTSFAAPYVSACAAFLLLSDEESSAKTVHHQLTQIAEDLGEEGKDPYYGYGMPNFMYDDALKPIEIKGKPTVTLSNAKYEYDGSEKQPSVTVTYEDRVLTFYDIEYPDNNPNIGSHKVKVTLVGNYTDTVSVTKSFQIVPKAVTFEEKGWASKQDNKVKVKWNKSKGSNQFKVSYQLKVSNNKNFKKAKPYSTSNTYKAFPVKNGKTYYVKVRVYKKVGKKTFYSDWSETRVIKILPR